MRRCIFFAVWLAIAAPQIHAQRGAGMHVGVMAARPAMVTPPAVHRVVTASGVRVSTGPRSVSRSGAMRAHTRATSTRAMRPNNTVVRRADVDEDDDFNFTSPFDFFGAPGLGFDETHFAAIHPRIFGRQRFGRFDQGFFPFGGGFLFPSSPVVIEQAAPAETAPTEDGAEEPVAQESARRIRPRETYDTQFAASPAPLKAESDEYVFVRRDGTVFFAVAYSWDSDTLRYITQEGVRRIMTRDALDLAATQQFNEQRGLCFRMPA